MLNTGLYLSGTQMVTLCGIGTKPQGRINCQLLQTQGFCEEIKLLGFTGSSSIVGNSSN